MLKFVLLGAMVWMTPLVWAMGQGTPVVEDAAPAKVEKKVPAIFDVLKVQPNDRVLGQDDAPMTLIDYASMTCPHCAHFHNDYLPAIKKEFIETGKLKFIQRDLPWDNMAMGISKVARCGPPEQYYPLINAFFETQSEWMKTTDPLGEIKKIARLVGMDDAKVEACVKDPDLQTEIMSMKETALDVLRVQGTPSFFLNGERLNLRKFEDVKTAIEAYAKKHGL